MHFALFYHSADYWHWQSIRWCGGAVLVEIFLIAGVFSFGDVVKYC